MAPGAASKFMREEEAIPILEERRRAGCSIVFTNGCFDLLHAGHVTYLEQARAIGDLLVVGINTDASVRGIKGRGRPINGLEDRALVLGGLSCVDVIIPFDEPDPHRLIARVRPHVLVKGADWAETEIVGGDVVEFLGGRVVRLPLREGVSTTAIVRKILDSDDPQGGGGG